MDWNAKLGEEMRQRLRPDQLAACEAACDELNISFGELIESVATAPGGVLDRFGVSVDDVAPLTLPDDPLTILLASVLHTARTME